MENLSKQDLFTRYRWRAAVVLVGLIGTQALLTIFGPSIPDGGLKLLAVVSIAIIPNLIASLITVFAIYLFVKDNDRTNYVNAMRSLRTAVKKRLTAGDIKPEHVQDLMADFVPAVSLLYFKNRDPKVPDNEVTLEYEKRKCFACEQASPVKRGRCPKCRDIRASWEEEDLSS